MSTRVLVFAKAPEAGRVKTRLIPVLGAQGAADLARRLLHHAVAEALAARLGPVELCASPALDDAAWRGTAVPSAVVRSDQGEGDLGERMARAAQRALQTDDAVLLIGTDCLALDAPRLRSAAQQLALHGATLHPAHDGGYVLLGLTRFDATLFNGIAWSTATVAATTRARFATIGWPLHEGETLHDLDEPVDLAHLPEDFSPEHRLTRRPT
ncbi:MAG: TIGR04282 family arsenosugar biosynthesis glycosyltransferase [Methylibium sp.]|nr:TIGR04282 family arsenosugar biosynthesis glycosyltransferase [Methylibium sp.]